MSGPRDMPNRFGGIAIDEDSPPAFDMTSYRDVMSVFQSRDMAIVTERHTYPFREGTINWLSGEAHAQRRRSMMRLVRGPRRAIFLQEVVQPLVAEAVATAPRAFDLVPFATRLFTRIAARFMGLLPLDEADTDALCAIVRRIHGAMGMKNKHAPETYMALRSDDVLGPIVTSDTIAPEDKGILADAVAAKEEYRVRFYEPALGAKRALLADRPEEGDTDLIAIIASGSDPAFAADAELALRETVNLLIAAVDTTVQNMAMAIEEIEGWIAKRPRTEHLRTDPDFLNRAILESIRIHPIVPLFIRKALADCAPNADSAVAAGECVAVHMYPAAYDAGVFGSDARVFDPDRKVPSGTKPYGVGFGHGAHKCLGMPLVIGGDEVEGTLMTIVAALYRAGCRIDPERPPERVARTTRDYHQSFFVTLADR